MRKTRPPYSPEFRRQMVGLVRAGRDPEEFAKEFESTAQSIRHWVAVADEGEGRRPDAGNALSSTERAELLKVRHENKQLRLERDILSRATARFAQETNIVPSGLRIHESESGRFSDRGDGARPRYLRIWLPCLAGS